MFYPKFCAEIGLFVVISATMLNAEAQTADRPKFKIGDSWTYKVTEKSDGGKSYLSRYEVTEVVDDLVKMSRINPDTNYAENLIFNSDLNYITDGIGRDTPSSIRFAFPLSVGQVIPVAYTFTSGERGGTIEGKCSVNSFEKVKLPAGDFDSFRVECKMHQNANRPINWYGRHTETLWYAPAARSWVRMDREIRGPNYWLSQIREMTEISLK